MVRRKKKYSVNLEIGKKMPLLYHTLPGQEFDYKKSEVLDWIAQQPEMLNFVREQLKSAGYIKYDRKTGLWVGVDYESDQMPSIDEMQEWELESAIENGGGFWLDQ